MQSLVKDIMGTIDITPTQTSVDWRGNQWFTGDLNTNIIKLQVIRNGTPVMLSENTTKAVMQIKSANGNYSNAVSLDVMDAANGIVGYTLDQEHNYPGAFNCQVALTTDQTKQRAITVSFGFSLSKDLFTSVTGDQVVKLYSAFWTMYDEILSLFNELQDKLGNMDGSLEQVLDSYLKKYADKIDTLNDDLQQAIKDYQVWKNLLGDEKDLWTAINQRVTYDEFRRQMQALSKGTPTVMHSIDEIRTTFPNGAYGTYLDVSTGYLWWFDYVNHTWTQGKLYQSQGLGSDDVNYGMRTHAGSWGMLISNQTINFNVDFDKKTITWDREMWVQDGALQWDVPSNGKISFTSSDGALMYSIGAKTLYVKSLNKWNDAEDDIFIGSFDNENIFWMNSNFSYRVNDVLQLGRAQDFTSFSRIAYVQSISPWVATSTDTELNLVTSNFSVLTIGGNTVIDSTSRTIDLSNVRSTGGTIYYDFWTHELYAENYENALSSLRPGSYAIGTIWVYNEVITFRMFGSLQIILNGKFVDENGASSQSFYASSKLNTTAFILCDTTMNFDYELKKITYGNNSPTVVIQWGGGVNYNPGSDLSGWDINKPTSFFYEYTKGEIFACIDDELSSVTDTSVPIGTIWGWRSNHLAGLAIHTPYTINGDRPTNLSSSTLSDADLNKIINSLNSTSDSLLEGEKMVTLGDSITEGLVIGTGIVSENYTYWAGKKLGIPVTNLGHSSGQIVGDVSNRDLTTVTNETDFSQFTMVTIAYGINDYTFESDLEAVKSVLSSNLTKIFKDNSEIKIYGILPHAAFVVPIPEVNTPGNAMSTKNGSGYTESELCDAISEVYQSFQIPVLDWRKAPVITDRGHVGQTSDGVLHPTQKTYRLIGARVANFIENNQ